MTMYKCPNCDTYDIACYFTITKCQCGIYRTMHMSVPPHWEETPAHLIQQLLAVEQSEKDIEPNIMSKIT